MNKAMFPGGIERDQWNETGQYACYSEKFRKKVYQKSIRILHNEVSICIKSLLRALSYSLFA